MAKKPRTETVKKSQSIDELIAKGMSRIQACHKIGLSPFTYANYKRRQTAIEKGVPSEPRRNAPGLISLPLGGGSSLGLVFGSPEAISGLLRGMGVSL